jgi:hypothetical protein
MPNHYLFSLNADASISGSGTTRTNEGECKKDSMQQLQTTRMESR